ncbi:MAG TPA: 16S rRNA (cytosine(1402)-N(4))-methyltransferase RsmH [Candidatus Limnocylindrales bacterium]
MSETSKKDPLDEKAGAMSPAASPEGGAEVELGHLPVMAGEVLVTLAPRPGSLQIDATLGGAGHAERVLEASSPDGRLLGLDADPAAIARSVKRLARFGERVVLRQVNFQHMAEVAPEAGFGQVDGLLLDLGLSSFQLGDVERGFGFRAGGRLDMRFDTSRGQSAADLLATLSQGDLTALFGKYGEEPFSGRIARHIVESRSHAPVETAEQLASLVERAVPAPKARRTHPATRVFQALRIAVNDELGALEAGLAASLVLLRPGGRLVVLSYHSLEDRIVKQFIAAEQRGCICPPEVPVCVCGRKPQLRSLGKSQTPSEAEVTTNPRSRSARLRAAERLAA